MLKCLPVLALALAAAGECQPLQPPSLDRLPVTSASGPSGTVLVTNRSSHDVAFVDAASKQVVGRVSVGRGPQQVALSPDGTRAYVANRGRYPEPHPEPIGLDIEKRWVGETSQTISVIDLRTREIETTFALAPFDGPHGLQVSRDGATLWVTAEAQNALLELDTASGQIRKVWDTPEAAHMVLATPDDRKLYLANTRVFSISVIDRETEQVRTIRTGRSPEGMALSPDGRELWVPNRGDDTIAIVDVATDRVIETIPTHGDFSLEVAFTPDGREAWVSNNNSNDLTVIDAQSRERIATVPLATQPLGLLIDPTGERVYVTLPRHNGVTAIRTRQRDVLGHIRTGIEPDGMAWAPARPSPPEPVTFETDDGVTVYGDLYLGPEGKSGPLILAFHQGGGDARGEYGPLAPRLLAEGYSVLAIDQRSGGDRFGSANRTVEALGTEAAMCDAYRDLEAALRYAEAEGFTGRRVAWGSSYSATLAIRLGVEHADALGGVLAFSPAGGGPMAECPPTPYLPEMEIPLLLLRPASEVALESVQTQLALAQAHGHRTFVSAPGTHGSSMLNADRVDGATEPTWEVVLSFLDEVLARP